MPDYDDPFRAAEGTGVRPRPGAGRRDSRYNAPAPRSASASSEPFAHPAPDLPSEARLMLGTGLNPIVRAAAPLLQLAARLRGTMAVGDVPSLLRQVREELRDFEANAAAAGAAREFIVAARYALCATLDEAALSTPWGSQSQWASETLLVQLHGEVWGGEKFFEVLTRMSQDPERYIDLLELYYLCLAFGFTGKYGAQERGGDRLSEVQRDLYRRIRGHRGAADDELSPRWRGLEDRRNPVVRYVPWWVVGAASAALLALVFTLYYAWLGRLASPVETALAQVGTEEMTRPRPAPPAAQGPTLKQLLGPEEQKGTLTAEEEGGLTRVTLTSSDLFASGSAEVSSAYRDTLRQIALAIKQVPGRVMIIGHTDDQPIRSLRYRDNFELSRERAVGVASVLQQELGSSGLVEWVGKGESEPRYTPPSTPENRARNRRVEIFHVRS